MNFNWNKYPQLPPAPKFPEWRDTPEREAYWRERDARARNAFLISHFDYLAWMGIVLAGFILLLVCDSDLRREWPVAVPMACFLSAPGMVLYLTGVHWWAVRKINRKFGGYPGKLQRPDLTGTVVKILDSRPDFSEAEFCKYWPDTEHAKVALKLREFAGNWCHLHKKILYPNDPIAFLMLGKEVSQAKTMFPFVDNDDFFEDTFDNFSFNLYAIEDSEYYEYSYAELVEDCLKSKNSTTDGIQHEN